MQDLLSKPYLILKKKIGQLLIKEENYAKIEHVWNIKMKSAKMLRVGDMFVQLLHKSFVHLTFSKNKGS